MTFKTILSQLLLFFLKKQNLYTKYIINDKFGVLSADKINYSTTLNCSSATGKIINVVTERLLLPI